MPRRRRTNSWTQARDVVWTLLGIAGLIYVAGWALRWLAVVVLLFALSALLAFILRPLIAAAERHLKLSRTRAALLIFAAVLALVAVCGAWAVTLLAAQINAAVANLPAAYQALQERIPDFEERAAAIGVNVDIRAVQVRLLSDLQSVGIASHGIAWVTAAGDAALNILLVLFLSFYLSVDAEKLGTALLKIAPARWKPHVLFAQKSLLYVVGGYVRGQLAMGAIVGTSVFLACLLLGIRYSLVLGVAGFFLEMIPMIGPFLIGATMVSVALLESVRLALLALGFYLLLQTIESNVLGPRITGHAVGLHPIASMLGLVAGGKLFGLWGALFAVPVLGFAFVIVAAVYRQIAGQDPEAVLKAREAVTPWEPWRRWRARRAQTHPTEGQTADLPHVA